MPALVAGIHVFFLSFREQGVDGRDKPGHDSGEVVNSPESEPQPKIRRRNSSAAF
jgi:hypothetical protein